MKIEHLSESVTLIHGDCRDALAAIGQVDCVLMDPPYEDHMHNAKQGARGIRNDGYDSPKALDFGPIGHLRQQVTGPLVEQCSGWLLSFCTPEGIAPWRDAIENAGAKYKRACFWEKPDSAPQFNGQGPAMGVEAFVTAWCGKGHSSWNGGGRRNLFRHLTNQPDRHGEHPTEKPISLMVELVSLFTNPGDLILDPFSGSGSTGVACVREGRRFVGIELNARYFDIACKRVADELRRPRFDLGIHPVKVKQEALDI